VLPWHLHRGEPFLEDVLEKQVLQLKNHLALLQPGSCADVCCTAADHLKDVVQRYKAVYQQHNLTMPTDPLEQLKAGVCAVFRSWNTPRAVKYREINKVTGLRGTAVNVQVSAAQAV
jgi:pyruvate, orthophosphate dikinase